MKYLAGVLLGVIFGAVLIMLFAMISHAQSPVAVVGPNGAITYVYPGTSNQPSIVVQPNGAYSYVYPMGPSTPPTTLGVVPISTPPPAFTPPSVGGY